MLKQLFIFITNACNLHCFGCGFGCTTNEKLWFITKEEYKETLLKLKNANIDNDQQYSINITGGEPLLHPDIFDLALMTREILPECICFIPTNGININKLSDEQLLWCAKNNIKLGITLYPKKELLQNYLSIKQRFEKLHIEKYMNWNFSRPMFTKPSLITQPNERHKYCFDNIFFSTPFVFIWKNKIYNCQGAFLSDRLKEGTLPENYTLNSLSNDKNLKSISTSLDCKNCITLMNEKILWHLKSDILTEELEYLPLKELYINHYQAYYILTQDCQDILECLNNDLFKKYFTPYVSKDIFNSFVTRFYYGDTDFFIPIQTKITKKMIKKILNIKNKNYNFYFIDYSNNKIIEEYNYNFINEYFKNAYILKAKSLYHAYKEFCKNSYLKNKILLNI